MNDKLGLCTEATYRITVQGILDDGWTETFNQLMITPNQSRQTTVLEGQIRDQSELMGILQQLNGIALPLLSVKCYIKGDRHE